MRLARGLVAFAWLSPLAARADDSPTSHDVPNVLEARIAALEDQLRALEAASEASLTAASASEAARDPIFRLYGFIDVGLQKLWATDDPVTPTQKTTFVLGNVNLYFDFHPAPDWSSLVEVRLTNYPNGDYSYGISDIGINDSRTGTTTADPGNGEGHDTVHWGAIVLERAYIQWQKSAKLGVRVGQFLTPYGIWNVDHGTPTLIALFRPVFQANEMFPEHQLGIEAFGRFDDVVREHWALGYHAYVSNGRTPGVVALTDDKMIGGRLVASTSRPYAMAFGVSALRGHYLDQSIDVSAVTGQTTRPTTVSYDEVGLGLDASVDLGPLRLRGEAAAQQALWRRAARALVGARDLRRRWQRVRRLRARRLPHPAQASVLAVRSDRRRRPAAARLRHPGGVPRRQARDGVTSPAISSCLVFASWHEFAMTR